MIVVTFKPGKLDVVGHAGYAPAGRDIVCAGASTLMYNLMDLMERKGCEAPPGAFHIRYDPEDAQTANLVGYTLNGLFILARKFPQNISIKGL